ncbi:MAG TPA: FAD-binding oxidoreductase [Candidatus Acidoferrales bacterium]|nr:FAD-binding oxidoreductase [Candidatus Acidoferrales bacterium]
MSAVATVIATRLAEIVGDANLTANPADSAAYAIGSLRPSAVVRPGSAEETAEVIKFAAAEKLAVVTCGARTKLDLGLPPRKYDLAMDMTRLNRVVACDPGDLTLSVEPGLTLRQLSAALAERGQFLPLEVPFFHRATVGGTIASAMDSPLRQLYGTPRDFILGMEFVTGEGTCGKSGGRVVKNVTGYDLHKLMIGSLGTLGVITKINFRTFPLPRDVRAFVATFDSAERALELRARVSRSPLKPLTMEVLSPGVDRLFFSEFAARIDPAPFPPNLLTSNGWTFTCGFTGTEKVLGRYEADLRAMAAQAGAAKVSILQADDVRAAFARKREFVAIARESSPAATIVKAAVLPTRVREVLATIESAANAESLPWAAMVRGVGVIYAALLPDAVTEDSRDRVARAANRIQSGCEKAAGHAMIPWCPFEWKDKRNVWGAERGDWAQMRKVKSVFDPQGILSPGRFVGGI